MAGMLPGQRPYTETSPLRVQRSEYAWADDDPKRHHWDKRRDQECPGDQSLSNGYSLFSACVHGSFPCGVDLEAQYWRAEPVRESPERVSFG